MSQLTPSLDPDVRGGTSATGVPTSGVVRRGDRVFSGLSTGSGIFVVGLIAAIGLFLLSQAIPALRRNEANFLTSREWSVGDPDAMRFGIADLLWTTVLSSVTAMLIAVPVAIGVALYITQYAPARLARPVAYTIDTLAAVPSIIFGLWGIQVLAPKLKPVSGWLQDNLGFIPIFGETGVSFGTVFVASVVLAIMILPIVTAISREVFAQVPTPHVEGALALGATKWEMIRTAVLPFGRPGVISASMLGLGRALGETIAVLLILSRAASGADFDPSLFAGGQTFASRIASSAAEFDTPLKAGAFIAAGLVLFVITFAVNAAARVVVNRRREFS
jgi:phosphate transport system permease protein